MGKHDACSISKIFEISSTRQKIPQFGVSFGAEAGLYAPKASTAGAGAREEELNSHVKETRRSFTLATKLR
jgi:hypothetical protein